jgi:hypothetical protein
MTSLALEDPSMTHEQAQQYWKEAETFWKWAKQGDSWMAGMTKLFGIEWRQPHDDAYNDGDGGFLRIDSEPSTPNLGTLVIRVEPAEKQEIRRWTKK